MNYNVTVPNNGATILDLTPNDSTKGIKGASATTSTSFNGSPIVTVKKESDTKFVIIGQGQTGSTEVVITDGTVTDYVAVTVVDTMPTATIDNFGIVPTVIENYKVEAA